MLQRFAQLSSALVLASSLLGCPMADGGFDGGTGIYTWGTVVDFLSTSPVESVDVCIYDTDNCTETSTEGTFRLEGLDEDADIIVSFDDNRYFPAIGMFHTSRSVEFDWNYRLPTEDAIALQTSLALDNGELERGKGQIFFAAAVETGKDKARVPGLTVAPAPGSEALGEVVYGNDLNVPDRSLTETTTSGTAIFANVEPGDYEFLVTGKDCMPYFSNDNPEGGTGYPVKVLPNTLSAVTAVCPE